MHVIKITIRSFDKLLSRLSILMPLTYLCDEYSELVKVGEAVWISTKLTDDLVEPLSPSHWILHRKKNNDHKYFGDLKRFNVKICIHDIINLPSGPAHDCAL